MWVIDVAGRKKLKVLTMPPGSKPMDAEAAPDGKRIYISNGRGGTVVAIDPATDSILGTVKVGQRPWGIALTPDGSKLYSANGLTNDLTVIDTAALKAEKSVPVGRLPWGVVIKPKS